MKQTSLIHTWTRSLSYWTRRILLGLYGPATQSMETDPIIQLKREYGRPLTPYPRGPARN
ncbi:MAG: hypothetical protein GC156_00080 [Actinomycetales bacterium]|nr:hypothetical protein [Actinomycetales bacterium]